MKKFLEAFIGIFILLTIILFSMVACADKENITEEKAKEKMIVAVTIVPEKTFAEAVCKDLAQVIAIVPPGSNPENYEPKPVEIKNLEDASIYFPIGVPMENSKIMKSLNIKKVIHLDEKVRKKYPDRTFESGERDPHIWLSPKRAKIMVEEIALEMGKIDEKNKNVYTSNAEEYIRELEKLDKEMKEALAGVENRKIIVYHPAFGYIAEDYNLEMYSLEEEGKEANIGHLKEMINLAKKEEIKVVFYQEEIDSRQSAAFAEEIGGKTIKLEPLAENYIENLAKMASIMAEEME